MISWDEQSRQRLSVGDRIQFFNPFLKIKGIHKGTVREVIYGDSYFIDWDDGIALHEAIDRSIEKNPNDTRFGIMALVKIATTHYSPDQNGDQDDDI